MKCTYTTRLVCDVCGVSLYEVRAGKKRLLRWWKHR